MASNQAQGSKSDRDDRTVLTDMLIRVGLARQGERIEIAPLDGGVSSDIVRIDLADGPVCVKRALPRLKVAALWEVPVERNAAEAEWFRVAAEILPDAAPRVLAEDRAAGLFVMPFLDPHEYPVWKQQLRDGEIDPSVAAAIGDRLATLHDATAHDESMAARFDNDPVFHAIRLEPYLIATAAAHPALANVLEQLARTTAVTKTALMHGDVSPKNILAGPTGPVFLDAECACYGDPAFDLAFCLNHLLLKCVWRRQWTGGYLDCFDLLANSYLAGVTWEPREDADRRAAHLLCALLLARIDGKSPVEYIVAEEDKDLVRRFATMQLRDPPDRLEDVRRRWGAEITP